MTGRRAQSPAQLHQTGNLAPPLSARQPRVSRHLGEAPLAARPYLREDSHGDDLLVLPSLAETRDCLFKHRGAVERRFASQSPGQGKNALVAPSWANKPPRDCAASASCYPMGQARARLAFLRSASAAGAIRLRTGRPPFAIHLAFASMEGDEHRCARFTERRPAYTQVVAFQQMPFLTALDPQAPGPSHARWPPFRLLCPTAPVQAVALPAEPAPALSCPAGLRGRGALEGDRSCESSSCTGQQQPFSQELSEAAAWKSQNGP